MKNKAIRHLERRAKKNDIAAAFQLYHNYKEGLFVEENSELSDSYLKQCISILNEFKVELTSISITDFRRIREADIDLNPKLTVLVGNNGTGKTTILEAASYCFGWFNSEVGKNNSTAKSLLDSDVNINSTKFADVSIKLKIGDTTISSNLARPTEKYPATIKSNLEEIRMLARAYRTASTVSEINYPLFAYYSVERSDIKGIQKSGLNELNNFPSTLYDGYKKSLDGRCDFNEFSTWFLEINNLSNADEINSESKIKNEISALMSSWKKLKDMKMEAAAKVMKENIEQKKSELNSLLKKSQPIYKKQLECTKKAFLSLIPGLTSIDIDRSSGTAEIIFEIFDEKINASKCSKGQQTVIALVGDLARRLTLLNSSLENPLHGQGIVLIDEIELHLHPQWQQFILVNLGKIFPNIQFIVTTHSPQILTTVKPECIRGLKSNNDNKIEVISNFQFSEGAEAQYVLEEILGVSSRPGTIQAVQNLYRYLELIKEDKWDSDEAKELRIYLDSWSGGYEPALIAADMDIRLRDFRRKKIKNEKNK